MIDESYSYKLRVQGDVGWDKKKLPEPNLHMVSKDDTQIMVYNMRRWPRKRDRKNARENLEN